MAKKILKGIGAMLGAAAICMAPNFIEWICTLIAHGC